MQILARCPGQTEALKIHCTIMKQVSRLTFAHIHVLNSLCIHELPEIFAATMDMIDIHCTDVRVSSGYSNVTAFTFIYILAAGIKKETMVGSN